MYDPFGMPINPADIFEDDGFGDVNSPEREAWADEQEELIEREYREEWAHVGASYKPGHDSDFPF